MSDVSSVTNHFPTANEGFITTLGSSILAGATTVPLTSVSGLTNGTIFVGIIEPGQAKQQTFTGVVDTAGVQITGVKWTRGTDVDHTAGVTIVDYVSGTGNNMITKGILEHANQDGTLKADAVDVTAVIKDGVITAAKSTAGANIETWRSEDVFDHIASGCVWSGNAYGSTRVASCTSGVVYLSGKRLTVAAVTSRTFTASKDVYCDLHDNGDGTAVWVYTDNTTNAASPALTAGNLRGAIVVVGATNIAAATSVNQGQETMVLPIASSVPYAVTDSLGNLICPRDPQRKLLGYKQQVGNSTFTGAASQIAALICPVIVPTGRKVKISIYVSSSTNPAVSTVEYQIYDGLIAGSLIQRWRTLHAIANNSVAMYSEVIATPTTASKTYSVGATVDVNTETLVAAATQPAYIKVELI